MSLFGNVGKATTSGPKAKFLTTKLGDFLMRVDKTKISKGDKGTFAFTEGTVLHSISGNSDHWKEGDFVADCQKKTQKTEGMFGSFIKRYVATLNGIDPNHKFSDDESENNTKWAQLSADCFGDEKYNPEKNKMEMTCPNPFEGALLHVKVVEDDQSGKDADKIQYDDQGKPKVYKQVLVLGLVAPEDIPAEVMEKYGKTLHPSYRIVCNREDNA